MYVAIEFWRQENWITGKVGCEKKSRKTQIRQMSNIIACQKLMIYSIPRICSNIYCMAYRRDYWTSCNSYRTTLPGSCIRRKNLHVTPLMKELHWLPVRQRIEFKINIVTYKAKNNLAPGYVSDMTEAYNRPKLNMTLRSSKQNRLDEKWSKHKRSGDRAYSVCGPKLWNLVPLKIRELSTVELFKKELKTNLFKKVFGLNIFY